MASSNFGSSTDVDEAISALSGPIYTLLADPSKPRESWEAFDLLCTGLTSFSVALAKDDQLAAEFGGHLFHGLSGVRQLHQILIEFEAALTSTEESDLNIGKDAQRRVNIEVIHKTRQELSRRKERAKRQLIALVGERPG